MFVSTYNNNGLKDTLMILFEKSASDVQEASKSGDMVAIKNKEKNSIVGYNLFNASTHLTDLINGPVSLSEENINKLNDLINEADFNRKLEVVSGPNFVVGYVKKCGPVEGSDHLSVTQIEIDDKKEVQIVCGASNIAQGQKVVVAKVGTIMPNGLIIWPGELKGVTSEGMVCSARELGLPQESDGIMVLDDDLETGTEFKL